MAIKWLAPWQGALLLFRRRRDEDKASMPTRRIRGLILDLERYERIFKGSQAYGFLDWDVPGNHMYWDGGFWAYLGYSERESPRISNPDTFFDYVHPDDRAHLGEAIQRHFKMNGPGQTIFRIRKKYGGYIWAEVRVTALRAANGHVLFTSGIVFDISKFKQTEEALLLSESRHARIIKSSNDGIWEWSEEYGGFHFSNRCWEQIGFHHGDPELNKGIDRLGAWRARIHPDDQLHFDRSLNEHFTKRQPFDIEYRIKAKEGTWNWIRSRGQMDYKPDGSPWRMSGTNIDITEIKRAEERVLHAKEMAEKANRAKSEFLSSMSHELRTPLNAILGFSQLFDFDTNLTDEQRDNIEEIKKAGQHLLELVGEVLDLAKIEAGKVDLVAVRVQPYKLVCDCISFVMPQAEARAISVNVSANNVEELEILTDGRRLRQILLNLLSNAVKYNKDRGSVRVDCRMLESGLFRIQVTDSGRGMSALQQESLFQPFNRLGAETTEIEGSGVGLVISKRLVEQMGGSLEFKSQVGEGSSFWVDLPLAANFNTPLESENAETLLSLREAENLTVPQLKIKEHRKILYVEDSKPNQRLMQQLLGRYPNIELRLVEEGFRGLYEARTYKPDLILLDINLPGMDGYETLEVLRSDSSTAHLPVIAISANAMQHDIDKGLDAGFDHYLTKPIVLRELFDVLNQHLAEKISGKAVGP